MMAEGTGSEATNEGTIETKRKGSYGMYALSGATVSNLAGGTIVTSGDNAHGMMAEGMDSKATNEGTIETKGERAYGMHALNGGKTVNAASGTIETEGYAPTCGPGTDSDHQRGLHRYQGHQRHGMYARTAAWRERCQAISRPTVGQLVA